MSQEYFSPKGKAPADNDVSGEKKPTAAPGPAMVTVGTGSISQYGARLQSMLGGDHDSGYGGSIAGDDVNASSVFNPAAVQADTPMGGQGTIVANAEESTRQVQAAALHQLWYNSHRNSLSRAINRALELLEGLQEMNTQWPVNYPSVARDDAATQPRPLSRPGYHQTQSSMGAFEAPESTASSAPAPLRRSLTSLEDYQAESSRAAERRTAAEPRLVTAQIAREFSILKLDLKLGALHQTELVHSLEKASIASLLNGKITTSRKHLLALRERIEDTASKVLVTGDLNSGKSTFCNALLRRKVLPEDQQPCTAIFCEVLDAKEKNRGIEEVHAVHKDAIYDHNDETTYDVYTLPQLEEVVTDNEKYTQCKVYVRDVRSMDQSLLNNGNVDIALIDAPGLNSDTTKTTAIFARQEEIDVVVFVVSAANHFTQTAKEFIHTAAAEKAYLFIVVNGYDQIRDKERLQKGILNQVSKMSPATSKEAAELVHFVSSSAIPMAKLPTGGPGGSGLGSSSGGGGGDGPGDDDPKGKGKNKEMIQDFSNLEQSLRRFVLEKRARSKLAPAKTYLNNILSDVNLLATANVEVAESELDRVSKMLEELEPQIDASNKAKTEINTQIDQITEDTCKDIYDYSRSTIGSAIASSGDTNLGVPYPGLFNAFQYADELKEAMLSHIAASVTESEEYARGKTVSGVNMIKQLGILHLGNEFSDITFRPDVMFSRRQDMLAKQVDIPTELWDFVDWSTLLQREEKTGMALTVAGVVGTGVIGTYGQVNMAFRAAQILGNDNLRRMVVPGMIVAALAATYYVLNQIPRSLPHRLNTKIANQLEAIDYVHINSSRISRSARKVLGYPAGSLRVGIQRSVDQLGSRRVETLRVRAESSGALKYFRNLVVQSADQRRIVLDIDLEHPQQGMGGL